MLKCVFADELHRRPLPGDRAEGEEPAVVHGPARPQPAPRNVRPGRDGGSLAHGSDRDRPRSRRDPRGRRRPNPAHIRDRQLFLCGPHRARSGCADRGHSPRPRAENLSQFPRVGPARRQTVSLDVSSSRTGNRRPHQGSSRLDSRPRACRPRRTRRAAFGPGVLFLRQGTRCGRAADRDRRGRGVPAVRRHRFPGGRAPHDEARLRGDIRALSQLSDSFACLAGEGARAGHAVDEVAAAVAAVSR